MKALLPELFPHIILPTERQSKINQLDSKILMIEEHNILQLEITMSNVLGMEVLQGFDELDKDYFSFRFSKLFFLGNNCK